MRLIFLSLLVLLCSCAKRFSPVVPIEQTNWREVFQHDPNLLYHVASKDSSEYWISVKSDSDIAGQPAFDYALYSDFDNDGKKEAVIPLIEGGKRELKDFLVFHDASPLPVLTDWKKTGNNLDLSIEEGKLLEVSGVRAAWQFKIFDDGSEPNGTRHTFYTLTAGKLHVARAWSEGDTSFAPDAVRLFYDNLTQANFANGYLMLSPRYHSLHPYTTWLNAYRSYVHCNFSDSSFEDITSDTTVRYHILLSNGRQEHGTWKLTWNSDSTAWYLDSLYVR